MMYLFSYFTTEEEKLFLSKSLDGKTWENVNDGKAILASSVGTGQVRDPFVYETDDGTFHVIWTDGWNSQSIGYASSKDLLNWEDERLIPVMTEVEGTLNTWAPEIFYDRTVEAHRIVWSSTVGQPKDAKYDHRIWSVTTKDFKQFSAPSIYFDPGYNVIDACVVDLGETLFMVYKDERGENNLQTEFKYIRSCHLSKTSENRDQPDILSISEKITPPMTEGPTLFKRNSTEWALLFDHFYEKHYASLVSTDLVTWTPENNLDTLPKHPRHGSVWTMKGKIPAI
ncbi:glycoside hydrolase family 43 protein [Aureibacillus halotolerans]|uniref:Glycosyl hydrolase family 43 n=1 Tax=Aureibacillus halotolerans TaxID=1508390 RepID=A0A4R6U254_9BACI|nr:glycoside hydrolase family 43 protein [Aureibacillus halotolerans]TDQ37184.1 glycosyl hydrolase family 43 [Aureibacillus halotolerans]